MGWHTASEVPPSKGVKVAGAQGVHAEAPDALVHVPAGHEGHWFVGLSANVPGLHGAQDPEVALA